jgi:F-type H+-transporting ATPase subunit b
MNMKKIVLLSLLVVPAVLLASSGHHDGETTRYFLKTGRENDFWPRVVNFTIFASILYYLLANPIKDFFTNRKSGIADQLKEIEAKLQAAKDAEKDAQARLEESENKAKLIVEDAEKEAAFLAEKMAQNNASDLETMAKQLEEKMALEEKKSVRDTIDEILNENITNDDIAIDEAKVVDIVTKKVA